jgi:hypothetical protein
MRTLGRSLVGLVLVGMVAACSDRSRPTVPVFGDLTVISDPAGAEITIDDNNLGLLTPATLEGVEAGVRQLELALFAGSSEVFAWSDSVTVPEEDVDTVEAALQGGCSRNCPFVAEKGRIICRATGRGDTCADVFFDAGSALRWPGSSGGGYGAGGRLLLAGRIESGSQAGDTIATQIYDVAWVGRRPVTQTSSGRIQTIEPEYWGAARYNGESLLGLEVKQKIVAIDSTAVEDVLFLQFTIGNISDDERYRRLYSWVPEGGYTYESLYVGFGLDADIGSSDDDLGTFDPSLDLSFIYDAQFQDAELGEFADRPALVGLVIVEAPAGASERRFTMWRREDDWDDGDRHGYGWRILAGRLAAGDPIEDYPAPEIGHQGSQPADYRITETRGPLRLEPGDAFSMTVALILAEPVPGLYTPGTLVPPGDPTNPDRQILEIAGDLRALAELVPQLWDRYRP